MKSKQINFALLFMFSLVLVSSSWNVKADTICHVTVNSSPTSPQNGHEFIYVNGGSVFTPFTYSCSNGSVNTFIADATVDGVSGIRYVFSSWSDSGARSHSVTVTSDITLTAYYTTQYSFAASAGFGGSISPSGTVYVDSGGSQAFTVTPTYGYQIQDVLVDSSSIGPVSYVTFSNVQASHTIYAAFYQPYQFSGLQVVPTQTVQGGALTFSGALYYFGTSTPPPDGDYNIQVWLSGISVGVDHTLVSGSWSVSASAPGSAGSYVYTCTASNTPYGGTFSTVTVGYTLAVSSSSGGNTNPTSGTYLYNSGTNVQVTASASSGYHFDHFLIDSSTLNYSNPVTVTISSNRAVQSVFILDSPPPDSTPPSFGTITANVSKAGFPVLLTCPVSDNVALSSIIFSWNNTGSEQNQTAVVVSGASVTANFTGTWNSSIGNTIQVKVYANDTSGNWGVSEVANFLLTDGVAPTCQSIISNTTTAGTTCLFSVLVNDNVNVSGYIFQSNITGTVANMTWTAFSSFYNTTAAYANVTAQLSGIVDSVNQWKLYFNDSSGNWALTDLQNITTTAPVGLGGTALITFHVNLGGLFYVNGTLIADNATLNCTVSSSLSLAAVPNSGYAFANFLWTNGSSASSPIFYTVSGNDTLYVYFSVVATTPTPGPGPSLPPVSQVLISVVDAHVSVGLGQTVSFDLTVTWQTGVNLTLASFTASGSDAEWLVLDETLPKEGGGSSMTLRLTCAPSQTAKVGQVTIPITVGAQSLVGGSLTLVSGTVYVTVSSGVQQLTLLEIIVTAVMTFIAFVVGAYGYFRR